MQTEAAIGSAGKLLGLSCIDLVFDAALGFVVGKAVAGRYPHGDSRVKILPLIDPIEGGGGLKF